MTRIAAVDCGTNSIRLLISDITRTSSAPSGFTAHDVTRRMEIVRLGQSVDATGELAPDAIERTRRALRNYVNIMKFENVEKVRMVATAAVRDAKNNREFFAMTAELLGEVESGAQAEVITGEEEAELSFLGAVQDLADDAGPFCVIDLGGGSTEFIVSEKGEELLGAHSAAMGCVRITERMMPSDPPMISSPSACLRWRNWFRLTRHVRSLVVLEPLRRCRRWHKAWNTTIRNRSMVRCYALQRCECCWSG